jgi:hypothetical protein
MRRPHAGACGRDSRFEYGDVEEPDVVPSGSSTVPTDTNPAHYKIKSNKVGFATAAH